MVCSSAPLLNSSYMEVVSIVRDCDSHYQVNRNPVLFGGVLLFCIAGPPVGPRYMSLSLRKRFTRKARKYGKV